MAQWRQRMDAAEAREIYKQRAATAECVTALARNRGLLRMPVRRLSKVRSVVGAIRARAQPAAHSRARTAPH